MTAAVRSSLSHALSARQARDRLGVFPITIEKYHQMIEVGIVPEDASVELLRGVIVEKDRGNLGDHAMGQSPLHKAIVAILTKLAVKIDSDRWHTQIQLPISCPPVNEPEPDFSIVRGHPRDYMDRLPAPADVSCVIEVAHSSLERDREDKLPIYAGAGVAQYVIVNLRNNTLEIHVDPDTTSEQYRTKTTVDADGVVQLRLPDGSSYALHAREILP